MNIQLHIEHVVLEGLPVDAARGPAVRAAIEAELGRLLAESGLSGRLERGGTIDHARGADIAAVPGDPPARLGERIGQAVYGGIRP
jgi:hypothetical protein